MVVYSIIPSCATCAHHQLSLDPEGCFIEVGETGLWGRFWVWLRGCDRYKEDWRLSSGGNSDESI
jgi:hypothetical protein